MQAIEAREGRSIDEILRDLYVVRGLSLEAVGAELAGPGQKPFSKSAVSRWLDRFGIAARRRGQAA